MMFFDKWYFHEGAVALLSHIIVHQKRKFMEMVKTLIIHLLVSACLTLSVNLITLIGTPGHFGGGLLTCCLN